MVGEWRKATGISRLHVLMSRPRRRPPQDFLTDIAVEDDGGRTRLAQPWSKNKLGILASYTSAFALACKSAGQFYFVDAMAGPGVYRFANTNEHLLGSTMIALGTEPVFHRVLSMDLEPSNVRALQERTRQYSERSVVLRGDANEDLVAAMTEHINARAPIFVLLDPEGTELRFQTVESVASFRQSGQKAEILVLLASSFLERLLPNDGEFVDRNIDAINRVLPSTGWQELWERKQAGEITSEEERAGYANQYQAWLRDSLKYRYTAARRITRPGSDATVYHLVFATDHKVGDRIMADIFSSMYPNEPPRLPGFDTR